MINWQLNTSAKNGTGHFSSQLTDLVTLHHLTQRSQNSNDNYIFTDYNYHWGGEEVVWFLVLLITEVEDRDTPNKIQKTALQSIL